MALRPRQVLRPALLGRTLDRTLALLLVLVPGTPLQEPTPASRWRSPPPEIVAMDDAPLPPAVSETETMNDSFIDQIAAAVQAVTDTAIEFGAVDPAR